MSTTLIKNAAWVIAWDEGLGRHVYRRGVDVAFTDDRVAFLGRGFTGAADRTIDGSRPPRHARADRHPFASRA